jgi:hypothetical protein
LWRNETMAKFVIEDEVHAEWQGQFASFDEALAELRRRATIPWDQEPNAAPCTSSTRCEREFVIVEFDDSCLPWKELKRLPVVNISASAVKWASGFDSPG